MQENVQQETAQASLSLGVQDLLLMFQIIQVVAQRGAFRADEMTNVGGLHDRLRAFLTSAGILPAPGSDNSAAESENKGDQS